MKNSLYLFGISMIPILGIVALVAIISILYNDKSAVSNRPEEATYTDKYTVTFLSAAGEPVRTVTARYRDIYRYNNKVVVTTATGNVTWTGSWEMEMEEGKGKVKE
jgi:uncharacterized protein affecting Mg2+/Co2+ transport